MSSIDFLRERFAAARDREALIWREQSFTYGWLLDEVNRLSSELERLGVAKSSVVSIEADRTSDCSSFAMDGR